MVQLPKHVEADIVTDDDGYKYYWPNCGIGMYSAKHLREIADRLDELNADWDKQVRNELNKIEVSNDELPKAD